MKGMDPTLPKDSHEPKINKSKVVTVTESLFLSPGPKYQLCLSPRIQHGLSGVHSTGKGKTENEAGDVGWLGSRLKDA